MSIGTYPSPFSSTAPLPLHPVQDVRDQLWSYHLQRSLETNWSNPSFLHQPYYLPFSALDAGFTAPPFLISALHYFEWHSTLHHFPLVIVQIHISPAFAFPDPLVRIVNSPQYHCPSIHVFWWDLPATLPLIALDYLEEYNAISADNINLFIRQLQDFHTVIALVFQTFISLYFNSFSYHFIPLYFNSINNKALQSNWGLLNKMSALSGNNGTDSAVKGDAPHSCSLLC